MPSMEYAPDATRYPPLNRGIEGVAMLSIDPIPHLYAVEL